MEYAGWVEIQPSEEELSDFYSGKSKVEGLLENQYLIINDSEGAPIDYYCWQNSECRQVRFNVIKNEYCESIKPKDPYQYCLIDMLKDKKSKVKIVKGVAGSGKDFLMFNEALAMIEKGIFQKIVYIRPNVTVRDVPEIGYLKGGIDEKLAWTLGPLYDKVGGEVGIEALKNEDKLEVVPLPFIRGRSFENSLVYVTEAQNMTVDTIRLLISRIGENSELWINADSNQVDKKVYQDENGVNAMVDSLVDEELVAYVYLPNTHRSKVAELSNFIE